MQRTLGLQTLSAVLSPTSCCLWEAGHVRLELWILDSAYPATVFVLNTCFVPGCVLGTGGTLVNIRDPIPILLGWTAQQEMDNCDN